LPNLGNQKKKDLGVSYSSRENVIVDPRIRGASKLKSTKLNDCIRECNSENDCFYGWFNKEKSQCWSLAGPYRPNSEDRA
jgi:hypothetical protein